MKLRWGRGLALLAVTAWVVTAVWQTHKPLPPGMHVASSVCTVTASEVSLATDITGADAYGRAVVSQGIFDEVLRVARGARRFIVLDYALIGAAGADAVPQRRLSAELIDALLEQRRNHPEIRVLFITDPVNESYGSAPAPELALLRAGGVEVVRTDLERLRDPNFMYSSLWRLTMQWWGGPPGALGGLLRELNYKANHRKVIVADDGADGLIAVVGSATPLDAQSAWSNTALRVSGGVVRTLLASELAVAHFSGWRGDPRTLVPAANAPSACDAAPGAPSRDSARVQVLTEGAIRRELLEQLDGSVSGDSVDLAAFKLADRGLIEALLEAARRGVHVRLILDPSEDATTLTPSGLPNQPVASELVSRSSGAIHVRWYRTHGERFHSSLALLYGGQRLWLLAGSANFTRRGLEDYNLDADLGVTLTRDAPLAQQTLGYFDTLWSNRAALGTEYTADFAAFADPSQTDYWLCRLLEGAGVVAF